ncbi:hypothetical protein [Vibrio sp. Vb0587]|uniref:hypothetical protein n=1 Tax=Vibrio sp. Vb0587 TaxID=3074626 RepID=UPI0029648C8B|nr:hypothetical protein [Vibrio sp. Vb0587]MDW1963941.1 hypothetical protein [Vibrio sp. Vb0587]
MDNKLRLVSCTSLVGSGNASTNELGNFLSLLSDSEKAQLFNDLLVESSDLIKNLLIQSKGVPKSLRGESVELLSMISEIQKNEEKNEPIKLQLVNAVGN